MGIVLDNLTPLQRKKLDRALEAFRRDMNERVIPQIVKSQRRRAELAQKSRHWIIG